MNKDVTEIQSHIIDLLGQLSDYSQAIYWLTDIDFSKVVYVSPTIADVTGATPTIFADNYSSWHDDIVSEDLKNYTPVTIMHKRIRESGTAARYQQQYRIIRSDGVIHWLEDYAFPVFDKSKNCIGLIGTTTDITSKKPLITQTDANQQIDIIKKTLAEFVVKMNQKCDSSLEDNINILVEDLINQITLQAQQHEELHTHIEQNTSFSEIQILLIDDNETRRNTLQQLLNAHNIAVTTKTYAQALPQFEEGSFESHTIIILSQEQYNDRASTLLDYLQASALAQNVMLTVALSTEQFKQQATRAINEGYYCALNVLQPSTFVYRLSESWNNWAKYHHIAPEIAALVKYRVLLVEDNLLNQKFTKSILLDMGFDVDIATMGKTALDYLENNSYALILMDITLPDMSGLDVATEFRKKEHPSKQTPIIALTSHASEKYEKLAMKIGINGYLEKPFTPDHLQEYLAKWIVPQV